MKKRWVMLCVFGLFAMILNPSGSAAKQFRLFERELNVFGFFSQSLQFSTKGAQHYDTKANLQQALMNAFVEADYRPAEDWTVYGSLMLTVDWNYVFDSDDDEWAEKRFDQSRDKMFVDDAYWQIVKELHVTWTPGDFLFRVGKQGVSWG